ncbi:MAG: hypothetical protein GYA17_20010 [Chloroflexi bacterium]|nr:hypothetical protein [Chloroflexota bacterium]
MANPDITRIAGNIGALNALQQLSTINNKLAVHQSRLASGKRINSAADDPAGLTIATKMQARSEGLKTALDNIGDAKNMLSVAESGLSKLTDILVQMRSKAEQAASDTLGETERQTIQTQLSAFAAQIDSIIAETKWNDVQLLDGNINKRFQTGADAGEVTTWNMTQKHDATTLGISTVEANNGTANEDIAHGVTAYNGDMAIFDGLSRLGTGTYQVKVDEVAATSTEGTLNVLTSVAGNNGQVTLGTVANATSELANGTSSIEITGYNTGTHALSYSLNGVAQSDVTITGDDDEIALGDTGVTVALADYGAAVQNGTYTIDYVQSDTARMQLQTASGTAIAVDANGSDGAPNATSTYFYVTASNTYNTGKGLQITAGDLTALTNNKGSVSSFDYVQANDNSVNVSTAELASNYMTTVNAALDTVNRSMADLGSLMARMSIKEEAVTSSQINVESSYNRIMNANMAEEQVNASKYLILQQTATAMLAQANTAPQFLLSLFQ